MTLVVPDIDIEQLLSWEDEKWGWVRCDHPALEWKVVPWKRFGSTWVSNKAVEWHHVTVDFNRWQWRIPDVGEGYGDLNTTYYTSYGTLTLCAPQIVEF